jgi:N-acetyl-anhydromuramyl-L-alanine amidase AmpD
MEYPEKLTAAEDVGHFFANQEKGSKKGSSAHVGFDENSGCRYVSDHDVAWAAPGANHNGLHVELAGYSKQSRADWGDEYSMNMLELAAEWVARKAHRYDIRPRKIGAEDIRAGRSGICGHLNVTHAYPNLGSHTDPGENFPWGHFMHRVHHYFGLHRSS